MNYDEKKEQYIRDMFYLNYFDLGIYRFLNRNKGIIPVLGLVAFFGFIPVIIDGSYAIMAISGGLFVLTIFLGAIDHMVIGRSYKRIIRHLSDTGVEVTRAELLEICKDILPE